MSPAKNKNKNKHETRIITNLNKLESLCELLMMNNMVEAKMHA